MTQRPWTFVSGFVVLTALGIVACSSADTPEDDDDTGTGGSSGSATGGSTATGGTASGGTASGGTATGGTSSGGTGGMDVTNMDPECKGISTGAACTLPAKNCPNLVCGLADTGRRECNCTTTWSCSSCNYDNSPFKDKPATINMCATTVADEVPCTTELEVCGPVGAEYCACYPNAQDGLIWDCDKPPTTWVF